MPTEVKTPAELAAYFQSAEFRALPAEQQRAELAALTERAGVPAPRPDPFRKARAARRKQ